MDASELLSQNEELALSNNQIISNVTGKHWQKKHKFKLSSSASFIVILLVVAAVFLSAGNQIPVDIATNLTEATDVQYPDAVATKQVVFQQALKEGAIPDDTAKLLNNEGVKVVCKTSDGYTEANKCDDELALVVDNKLIKADEFISEVNSNVKLYSALNDATYSRAAYYYDEPAEEALRELGITRNSFRNGEGFDEVMEKAMKSGNNIDINSVSLNQKTTINETSGKEETYTVYEETGANASLDQDTTQFINEVANKTPASTVNESTLNSADTLKVADTVAKEQRSSLFFAIFMESVSKMKAGDGKSNELNEAMNYLFTSSETEVVDVETGEIKRVTGSPMESPSLYALLSGEAINPRDVQDYSSDRVLKTIENKLGETGGAKVINTTVASTSRNVTGSVGRFIDSNNATAARDVLNSVGTTISNSLVNNSYESIKGIPAGEFLVEGAVNVGKRLARASGASSGDENAVLAYQKLTNDILAMDAKVDRMKRSPFDITSKNTFLGSIVYRFAITASRHSSSFLGRLSTITNTTTRAAMSLMPTSFADDAKEGYLSYFGDCETYGTIGAVGSAQCSEIATFDTSTLNDPFNDQGFIDFVESNTTLNDSGQRTIKQDSILADYILYNDKRTTPLGTMDGGILETISSKSKSIPFISKILNLIKSFLGASNQDKRVATGAAFVNSSSNKDWPKYKYAQRYISIARAKTNLMQYSDDPVAYNNLKLFEGNENPVVAFLRDYYAIADK